MKITTIKGVQHIDYLVFTFKNNSLKDNCISLIFLVSMILSPHNEKFIFLRCWITLFLFKPEPAPTLDPWIFHPITVQACTCPYSIPLSLTWLSNYLLNHPVTVQACNCPNSGNLALTWLPHQVLDHHVHVRACTCPYFSPLAFLWLLYHSPGGGPPCTYLSLHLPLPLFQPSSSSVAPSPGAGPASAWLSHGSITRSGQPCNLHPAPCTLHFSDFLGAPNTEDFEFSEMSELPIMNFVKQMKPKSSFGADLVSNKMFKSVMPTIIQPVKHLINLSLKTGYSPDSF